jgi:hypothetical protein
MVFGRRPLRQVWPHLILDGHGEPIELTRIRRQHLALAESVEEQERIKEYREAVAEARDGKVAQSFYRLDKLNAIEQCMVADQLERIAVR